MTTIIKVGGLEFTVRTAGPESGSVVLCLHGFPQTSYAYRQQMAVLAEMGFRVVAPDQRGYSPGARFPDVSDYTVNFLVGDVIALADQLNADRFHLVGHDWGGAVSWLVAAAHPERLKSLSILSRPHPLAFARAMQETETQAHRSRHHKAFLESDTEQRLLEDDARLLRSVYGTDVPKETIDAYVGVLGERAALTAALNWYRAAQGDLGRASETFRQGLKQIAVPTLYVWGDDDATVGPEAAQWTADYISGPYSFEVLKGIGHFSTDQAPENVARLLLAHISKFE